MSTTKFPPAPSVQCAILRIAGHRKGTWVSRVYVGPRGADGKLKLDPTLTRLHREDPTGKIMSALQGIKSDKEILVEVRQNTRPPKHKGDYEQLPLLAI